jgi:spore coat polysaccharide biosynthesis protein SpsF (cytidylyltransferase family)
MNLGIIIQARLESTRLSNKIILNFCDNKSILDIIIEKIKLRFSSNSIILSTGDMEKNYKLAEISDKHSIKFFPGSENNVLDRFIETAKCHNLTHIIRICSDNPFIDMGMISDMLAIDNLESYDYVSFKNDNGIPMIKSHIGLFCEIVSLSALNKVMNKEGDNPAYIEHVTNYIYEHPEEFNTILIDAPGIISARYDIRLTVDTHDDFNLLSDLYRKTNDMGIYDLVNFLDENKEQYIDRMLINIKNNNK